MALCFTGITSYPLDCREASGIQDIWVSPYSASTVYTYTSTDIVTGATNPGIIYNLAVRMETAEYHPGVLKADASNGTVYYEETLSIILHKYQTSLRSLLITLGKGECVFYLKTQNGKYFLMGEENGALLTEGDASLGKTLGDLNGATMSFVSKQAAPSREVSATFFSSLTQA